jgi:hypothetical protein
MPGTLTDWRRNQSGKICSEPKTMTRRPFFRFLAIAAAACVGLTQVALAGYACPLMGETPQAMHEAMEGGECYKVPEAGSKTLCHKTCQDEPQKRDIPSVDIPAVPVSEALPVDRLDRVSIALLAMPPDADLLRATSPPPRIQHSRFLK